MMACLFVFIMVAMFIAYIDGQQTSKQKIKAVIFAQIGILLSLTVYLTLLKESGGVDAGKWMAQLVFPTGVHGLILLSLMAYLFRILRK